MRDKLEEAQKQSKAEYTKTPIEDKETTWVSFHAQELETANANIDKGVMARCLIWNKGCGVATLNDLDDLVPMVNPAHQYALVGTVTEPIELAHVEPVDSLMMVMLGI